MGTSSPYTLTNPGSRAMQAVRVTIPGDYANYQTVADSFEPKYGSKNTSLIEQALSAYAATTNLVQAATEDLGHATAHLNALEKQSAPYHQGQNRLSNAHAVLAQAVLSHTRASEAVRVLVHAYPHTVTVVKIRTRVQAMAAEIDRLSRLERELAARRRAGATGRQPCRPAVSDVQGRDLRPDPLEAASPQEFMGALRRYRQWAGDVSFRVMAQRAGNAAASASTMCTTLNRDTLPRLDIVMAIVTGCGGGEEDRERFATAWRTLRLPPARPSCTARPLRSVPASLSTRQE